MANYFLSKNAGRINEACAMLTAPSQLEFVVRRFSGNSLVQFSLPPSVESSVFPLRLVSRLSMKLQSKHRGLRRGRGVRPTIEDTLIFIATLRLNVKSFLAESPASMTT